MTTCLCQVCCYYRQVLLIRNYGNAAARQWLIDDLYERLCHCESDLDVWQAVWQGTWPNARHYAEVIMKRCDALGTDD